MTYEEYCEIIDKSDFYVDSENPYDTKIIEALEKQIPKKPILKDGESVMCVDYADGLGEVKRTKWREWTCPDCSWFVGEQYVRINGKTHNQRKCNFCPKCSQAIDWEDEKCLHGQEHSTL